MGNLRSSPIVSAFVISLLLSPIASAQTQFLQQNWDDATRQLFYTTSQGSRLIPYDWFMALEVSDGTDLFVRTRLLQLGYLPNPNSLGNPDRLPVGFVADTDFAGRKYLGLNCAACHTSQILFKGKIYQIDGAPTLADMWGLLTGIRDSLNATAADEAKFRRFANKVLGPVAVASDVADLRHDLEQFRNDYKKFVDDSNPDPAGRLTWGRARLDAFGMIFNRASSIDLDIPANSAAPNAPVSYPHLWGSSWQDRVQWNGSAPNRNDIERLGRNVGEVLGVFGQTDLQRASILRPYYRTSARRLNQVLMENWLKRLAPPAWPGEIDAAKRDKGKVLFERHCADCHQSVQPQFTPIKMTPVGDVGTDNRMALNAIERKAKTGRLEGSVLPSDLDPLPQEMPTGALLVNIVHGAIISPFHDVGGRLGVLQSLKARLVELQNGRLELAADDIAEFMRQANIDNEAQLRKLLSEYQEFIVSYKKQLDDFSSQLTADARPEAVVMANNPYVYKARSLDGIWATAPYLHNGSVPNLYELLLPANMRTPSFHVGNPEFDPDRVGFRTTSGATTTELDTLIPGNLNTGHDQYGNKDFSEEDRMNLVEYLKSL